MALPPPPSCPAVRLCRRCPHVLLCGSAAAAVRKASAFPGAANPGVCGCAAKLALWITNRRRRSRANQKSCAGEAEPHRPARRHSRRLSIVSEVDSHESAPAWPKSSKTKHFFSKSRRRFTLTDSLFNLYYAVATVLCTGVIVHGIHLQLSPQGSIPLVNRSNRPPTGYKCQPN